VNDCALPETGLVCVGKTPSEESCNYVDDDCDGVTDEGQGDLFTSCSAGLGICQRFGFIECADDGAGAFCNAVAVPAGAEVCNGVDDDCDGSTDESHPTKGTVCTVGVGVCLRAGVTICNTANPAEAVRSVPSP
jgi:hypothetical protein